jgi:MtrB/PioB family decaheme-associated outer membrane protein
MKTKFIFPLLVAMSVSLTALAGEMVVSGDVSIGLRGGSYDEGESAKFEEYGDWEEGLYGRFSLFGAKDGHFFNASADATGVKAGVGCAENGRLSLFYDKFDHNYSFDNWTPHQGVGSETLPIGSPHIPVSDWQPLDYSVEHKHYGANFDLTAGAPFFFSLGVERIEKDGIIPFGAPDYQNFTPIEMPLPVDDKTTNTTTELAYRSKKVSFQLDGAVSEYDNQVRALNSQNIGTAPFDPAFPLLTPPGPPEWQPTIPLAPDNDMWQIGGQLVLRDLPLNSVLALRGSYSQLQSEADLLTGATWDGDIAYTTASLSLRSEPVEDLDTELSYRYVDKDNESDQLDLNPGVLTEIPERFHYTKHNAAFEASYRLNKANRVSAGYDFLTVDRAEEVRPDAENSTTHAVFAEWKNTALKFLTTKVRFDYENRDADVNSDGHTRVSSPFDAASREQYEWTFSLGAVPMAGLDMGLNYNYRSAEYDDTEFGRTDERVHKLTFDTNVALPGEAMLRGYAAYEKTENQSTGEQWGGLEWSFGGGFSDPWDQYDVEVTDEVWTYGVKLEAPLFERTKLTVSYDYQKNDGSADFDLAALQDVSDYDDYTLKTLNLMAEIGVTENLSLIVGYLYKKYDYADIKMEGYELVPDDGYIYTGAYSEPDYEAKIGYMNLKYTF